jgi:hypothetical protein
MAPTYPTRLRCCGTTWSTGPSGSAQVRVAVAAGARTPREVVEIVYADVPRAVWGAAELSVRAQLAYLERGSTTEPVPD